MKESGTSQDKIALLTLSIQQSPAANLKNLDTLLAMVDKKGVCAMCYGRNLATNRLVEVGESVGVMAAQSIGEPGTQLTLRTFHVGGTAQRIISSSQLIAKFNGKVELENVKVAPRGEGDEEVSVVISRTGKIKILDEESRILFSNKVPYGSIIEIEDGQMIEKGTMICSWDPYNSVILSDFAGKLKFKDVNEGQTFLEDIDEQTGHREKIIIDSRDKTVNPTVTIVD